LPPRHPPKAAIFIILMNIRGDTRAITDITKLQPVLSPVLFTSAGTGRTYGLVLCRAALGLLGAPVPPPVPSPLPYPNGYAGGYPIILMATRAATPIIRAAMPVVRGRISDSEACSIRRALDFNTNTERRRESPTNMRPLGDLDTNIRARPAYDLTRRRTAQAITAA